MPRPPEELAVDDLHGPTGLIYERRLDADLRWALNEGSKHFEGKSSVQLALRKITRRLDELGIPYVVVGGMSLFAHGLRRFTEDVDILVTQSGLREIHGKLVGRGYLRPFEGARNLRDTESGVRIEFLITGQYPGDRKPESVAVEIEGIKYLSLAKLVELKLASGMTSRERGQDLVDVQELIKICKLGIDFTRELDAFVHEKYVEVWRIACGSPGKFVRLWTDPGITPEIGTMDQLIAVARAPAELLVAMRADGVTLELARAGHARLVCTDPAIAARYEMHSESEFFDLDAE